MLTTQMENLEKKLFEKEQSILSGQTAESLPLLEDYAELLRQYLLQKNLSIM